MRIKLEFVSDKLIVLRSGYNSLLQGLIYDLLDYVDAVKLHDEGFRFEKRQFRLFTFSEILEKGTFDRKSHIISFVKKLSFILSSPVDWILRQVAVKTMRS